MMSPALRVTRMSIIVNLRSNNFVNKIYPNKKSGLMDQACASLTKLQHMNNVREKILDYY